MRLPEDDGHDDDDNDRDHSLDEDGNGNNITLLNPVCWPSGCFTQDVHFFTHKLQFWLRFSKSLCPEPQLTNINYVGSAEVSSISLNKSPTSSGVSSPRLFPMSECLSVESWFWAGRWERTSW